MRLYGLMDCNNFFVSCERLFRPDLKNYPTVVLGSNDGVVVSRSEEAKKLGVPMGVPFFKVKDIFEKHKVALFSSNFELNRDISNRVIETLREDFDQVEQYSIDEAFFELEGASVEAITERLSRFKARVEREIGIPVSLGAAKTMTIAKFASEREKRKSGVCVLLENSWTELHSEIPLGEIWGIGGKTAGKMRDTGLLSVSDFLALNDTVVKAKFGVHGLRLHSELREKPAHSPGERRQLQKSIMSTRSFSKTTTSLSHLEAAISLHTERVAKELREINGKTALLTVILGTSRHDDWFLQGGKSEVHLPIPSSDTRTLLKEAIRLTRATYRKDIPYKKAGVVVSNITEADSVPVTLWSYNEVEDDNKLMSTVDLVNEKFGKNAITFGRIETAGKLDKDKYRSPRYTTSWNELKKISAR